MKKSAFKFFAPLARILGVTLLVVGFSEALIELNRTQPDVSGVGYLVKNGGEYLAIWNQRRNRQPRAFRFVGVKDAERHLRGLGLVASRPRSSYRMERLWLQRSGARKTLFWKVNRSPYTNRLTFARSDEASFFFRAFERGFYTESPFGHAIFYSAP